MSNELDREIERAPRPSSFKAPAVPRELQRFHRLSGTRSGRWSR